MAHTVDIYLLFSNLFILVIYQCYYQVTDFCLQEYIMKNAGMFLKPWFIVLI